MILDWLPEEIAQAVEKLDLSITVHSVPEIDVLLGKTVLFRGKKFRPTLCFLTSRLLDLPLDVAQHYARAAEFVHAATLAHDDVIDESPVRRNRPTLNVRSSNARAVLAGDLLLARVMAELSALGELDIIRDLAMTVEELVKGEWLQLEARKVSRITREHLETVARKKTASLMSWCCGTPARLVRGSPELIQNCQNFGDALGISFQMIDDIIDYDTSGEKPFAQDLREGLVNFVTLEMLEANSKLHDPIQRLLGDDSSHQSWPWQPYELVEACDRVRIRAQAKLEAADQILSEISKSLKSPHDPSLNALRSILVYLRERIR